MKISVLTDAESLFQSLSTLFDWADDVDMAVAWATSAEGTGRHWRAMDLAKVRRAVIGTEFAQTEPWALSVLGANRDRLRIVINSTGTFHPKAIVGTRGKAIRAIVGSANFTSAAYTTNTELNVLLEGVADAPEFRKLSAFLDEQWTSGVELDDGWLAAYTKVWEAAKRQKIMVPQAKLEVTSLTSLDISWADFVALIAAQEHRPLRSGYRIKVRGAFPSYSGELNRTLAVFAKSLPFADLAKEDRTLLMGIGKDSSGLIGRMKAAGYARGIVNSSPEKIGNVLDRLPLSGPVSLALASELVNAITSLKGVKLGVASRLFAVKRPDLFVSVNKGSNPSLAKLFGGRPITTAKQYIELLRTIWSTTWHRSTRPLDAEEAILWDQRAVLLDSALYEEV